MKKKFFVVNSFTKKPFGGNPAGVFLDAEGLTTETMQKIAKQLNLVETVFVMPAKEKGADFELRYFMPEMELPIAGHPTIAAFTALEKQGRIDTHLKKSFFIQTKKGIQEIRGDGESGSSTFIMEQPEAIFHGILEEREIVANLFGINPNDLQENLPIQSVDTGLGHLIVPVKNLSALFKVKRNTKALKELCEKYSAREAQLFTFKTYDRVMDLHTRNICPREGIEDPACGNGNGALGAYLLTHFYKDQQEIFLMAEQGNIVDMPSMIEIHGIRELEKIKISIGGKGVVMIEGDFFIG